MKSNAIWQPLVTENHLWPIGVWISTVVIIDYLRFISKFDEEAEKPCTDSTWYYSLSICVCKYTRKYRSQISVDCNPTMSYIVCAVHARNWTKWGHHHYHRVERDGMARLPFQSPHQVFTATSSEVLSTILGQNWMPTGQSKVHVIIDCLAITSSSRIKANRPSFLTCLKCLSSST